MAFSMPNDQIRHRTLDLLSEVRKADPKYDYESRVSPSYEFSSRTFSQRDKNFGPYAAEEGGSP